MCHRWAGTKKDGRPFRFVKPAMFGKPSFRNLNLPESVSRYGKGRLFSRAYAQVATFLIPTSVEACRSFSLGVTQRLRYDAHQLRKPHENNKKKKTSTTTKLNSAAFT